MPTYLRRTVLLRTMLALVIGLSGLATWVPAASAVDPIDGVDSTGTTGFPVTPVVLLSRTRATVNTRISFTLGLFTPFEDVAISWKRPSGGLIPIATVPIDAFGGAEGTFKVPATPGGANQEIQFVQGALSKTVNFEIIPRIKVLTDPAQRAQTVNVSLRGYAKGETVRIRWKNGNRFVQLASVKTSSTGSANVDIVAPLFAPDGENTVRGDGTIFRSETKTVTISGGPTAAEVIEPTTTATPTPSPTATPESTATPTIEPNETVVVTAEPTAEPTEEATPEVTPEPTVEPTSEPVLDPTPESTVEITLVPAATTEAGADPTADSSHEAAT